MLKKDLRPEADVLDVSLKDVLLKLERSAVSVFVCSAKTSPHDQDSVGEAFTGAIREVFASKAKLHPHMDKGCCALL